MKSPIKTKPYKLSIVNENSARVVIPPLILNQFASDVKLTVSEVIEQYGVEWAYASKDGNLYPAIMFIKKGT